MEKRIMGYSPVPGSAHEKQVKRGGFYLALHAVWFSPTLTTAQ